MKLSVERNIARLTGEIPLMKVDLEIRLPDTDLTQLLPAKFERTVSAREASSLAAVFLEKMATLVINPKI